MENFGKHVAIDEAEDNDDDEISKHVFKPFHETYRLVAFAMSFGMIYPNPNTEKWRLLAIPLSYATAAPMLNLANIEMYNCYKTGDLKNFLRHTTMTGPFMGEFFKMCLMYHKRIAAKMIIDEISRDMAICNQLPIKYKRIARDIIKSNVLVEKGWCICVVITVFSFPVVAGLLMVYSFLFSEEPERYMIHDINVPNREPEARFESPYFELMFMSTCWGSVLYTLNFTGCDGFMLVSVLHLSVKMKLYTQALVDALKVQDDDKRMKQVIGVVQEQLRMYRLVEKIEETFRIFLGTLSAAMVIQICSCIYYMTQNSKGFKDMRYCAFTVFSIIYMFLPCSGCGLLKYEASDTADAIYCSGWEDVRDYRVRRMIVFMLARAQAPLTIQAFGLYDFDRELFVKLMKMSYSMLTLLLQT